MTKKCFSIEKPRENWNKYFKNNTGLIIDLGCGYGADSHFLAEKGYKIISIDENKHIKFSHPNITFKQQKLEKLVEGEFDGVIANFSLHFLVPELRLNIISHYLNNLKKDGIFYILIFEKFVTPAFLKLFPQKPKIETYQIKDDHSPIGKHTHDVAKVVYSKPASAKDEIHR